VSARTRTDLLSRLRDVYLSIYELLLRINCHVTVYGNTRGSSSDIFVTGASKMAKIPSIAELVGLYPGEVAVPDVIVGPSWYAVNHPSIHNLLDRLRLTKQNLPALSVIPPGINTTIYHPLQQATTITEQLASQGRNISLGFIGRLAPDKNPGLFLLAAHAVMKMLASSRIHININLYFLGDGPLKSSLMELAKRLNIDHVIHFSASWISSEAELVEHLHKLDIVVQTSFTTETFCIANLETMAVGIPIITFAVGGSYRRQSLEWNRQ
jgi:glycosyltransferase involved in cell wall biosynthesis